MQLDHKLAIPSIYPRTRDCKILTVAKIFHSLFTYQRAKPLQEVGNSTPIFMQFLANFFKSSDGQKLPHTRGSSIKGLKVNLFLIISPIFHLSLCKASHLIATKSRLFGGSDFKFLKYFARVVHTSSLNSHGGERFSTGKL